MVRSSSLLGTWKERTCGNEHGKREELRGTWLISQICLQPSGWTHFPSCLPDPEKAGLLPFHICQLHGLYCHSATMRSSEPHRHLIPCTVEEPRCRGLLAKPRVEPMLLAPSPRLSPVPPAGSLSFAALDCLAARSSGLIQNPGILCSVSFIPKR